VTDSVRRAFFFLLSLPYVGDVPGGRHALVREVREYRSRSVTAGYLAAAAALGTSERRGVPR
jgi:hypothetical protein